MKKALCVVYILSAFAFISEARAQSNRSADLDSIHLGGANSTGEIGTMTANGTPLSTVAGQAAATATALTAETTRATAAETLKAPIASPTFTGTVTVPSGAALATPSTLVLTNATGLPVSSGMSGAGTGVITALGQAVTGSGGMVLATSPVVQTGLGLLASGSSTDALLSIAGGGAVANQGILTMQAAQTNFQTWDGHTQFSVVPTLGANEYWCPSGGITYAGALLATCSSSSTYVDAVISMLGTGSLVVGNGTGTLLTVADPGGAITSVPTIVPGISGGFATFGGTGNVNVSAGGQFGSTQMQINGQTNFRISNDYGSASIVNYLDVYGAPSGSAPSFVAKGTDANIPIYFNSKGSSPVVLATNSVTTFQSDGTGAVFVNGISKPGYTISAPTTGGTVTASCSKTDQAINPAGTLATLTINMCATPRDGLEISFLFTQTITALTVSGNGNSIAGAPTTAGATSPFKFKYLTSLGWVRTQ